jgi:hypothetical protein
LACTGLSIRNADDEFGVSKSALGHALQGYYCANRGAKRKLNNAEVIWDRQRRATGEDVKGIATDVKVSVATVSRALTKPRDPKSSPPKNAVQGNRKVTTD